MPRILLACVIVLVGSGCFFDADYGAGTLRCSDGRCPSDRPVCHEGTCVVTPPDAAVDADLDAPDARIAALTCADPGQLPATGGTAAGTTVGRASSMSSSCGGFVMNGADAVYRIEVAATTQVLVDIAGGRKAYVLASCIPFPNTPACIGNMRATAGNPISVSLAPGASFLVVDDENAASASAYTLTVTPQ